MATEDQTKSYKTFSFRVKDATSKKRLVSLGNAVNTVWNYCNEISARSAQRGPSWATKKQLRDLTKGSSRELSLPSAGYSTSHRRIRDQAEGGWPS